MSNPQPNVQSILITLEQARDKRCPYGVGDPLTQTCRGTGCMAFTKTTRGAWQRRDGHIFETYREPQSYDGGHWVDRYYCARVAHDSGATQGEVK